jgi:hypothetical protein
MNIRTWRNRLFVLFLLLGVLTGAAESGSLRASSLGWTWCNQQFGAPIGCWWQDEPQVCAEWWNSCTILCGDWGGVKEFLCVDPPPHGGYCTCNDSE